MANDHYRTYKQTSSTHIHALLLALTQCKEKDAGVMAARTLAHNTHANTRVSTHIHTHSSRYRMEKDRKAFMG